VEIGLKKHKGSKNREESSLCRQKDFWKALGGSLVVGWPIRRVFIPKMSKSTIGGRGHMIQGRSTKSLECHVSRRDFKPQSFWSVSTCHGVCRHTVPDWKNSFSGKGLRIKEDCLSARSKASPSGVAALEVDLERLKSVEETASQTRRASTGLDSSLQ
ncbi:hypothetical protein Taro_005173, partial [Colocasia esculenta]|nr:hypothetical protein [Colocasia esculenta]